MNFLDYKTPEELFQKTGLTIQQAIQIIDEEIKKLKEGKGSRHGVQSL